MAPMDFAAPPMLVKRDYSGKRSVLFVCMGNICRSPALMAELHRQAKERGVASDLIVDSCAMTAWHVGEPPDYRIRSVARAQGLEIEHTAKLFQKVYFTTFEWILAVDREVLHLLEQAAKHAEVTSKIVLATAFSKTYKDQDITDPYYGGKESFELTLRLAKECCQGILDVLFHMNSS